jgi:hypothetical protein
MGFPSHPRGWFSSIAICIWYCLKMPSHYYMNDPLSSQLSKKHRIYNILASDNLQLPLVEWDKIPYFSIR